MILELLPCEVDLRIVLSDVATTCQADEESYHGHLSSHSALRGFISAVVDLCSHVVPPATVCGHQPVSSCLGSCWTAAFYPSCRGASNGIWNTSDSYGNECGRRRAVKEIPIGNGDPIVRFAVYSAAGVGEFGTLFVLTLHRSLYDMWSFKFIWKVVRTHIRG